MGTISGFSKRRILAMLLVGFLTIFISPKISLATEQIPEKVVYEGKEYSINEFPLEPYLIQLKTPIHFDEPHTALWRGYETSWEFKGKELLLTDLAGSVKGKKVSITDVFLEAKAFPILAVWYSGNITVNIGESQGYWNEKVLKLNNGLVVSVEDVKHKLKTEFPTDKIILCLNIILIPIGFFVASFIAGSRYGMGDKVPLGVKVVASIIVMNGLATSFSGGLGSLMREPGYYLTNGFLRVVAPTTLGAEIPGLFFQSLIFTVIPSFVAWELLRLKNWARIVVISIAALVLFLISVPLFFMTGGAPSIFDWRLALTLGWAIGFIIYFLRSRISRIYCQRQG